tara:strand:- start:7548 stop:7721 length:174 start_codon:yes stop_codon:yes gene_type:complete
MTITFTSKMITLLKKVDQTETVKKEIKRLKELINETSFITELSYEDQAHQAFYSENL